MNPEFQRNLWLELTPQRLVMMPLIQGLIYALVLVGQDTTVPETLASVAYWLTLGLGGLWGTRLAAEAVVDELSEGTWDQQRLSSLSPWSMTWGKLFGATVFTWYGCVPSLLIMVSASSERLGVAQALLHGAVVALMLVFAHAVALMASLHAALRGSTLSRRTAFTLQLAGLVALFPWISVSVQGFYDGFDAPVTWYGETWDAAIALLLSLCAFTAWAILGCYRLMREELRIRNAPWVWLCFVVFCILYAVGWSWEDTVDRALRERPLLKAGTIALVTALSLAYLSLFTELKDPVAWRRVLGEGIAGHLRRAAEGLPLWLCTLPVAAAAAALTMAAGIQAGLPEAAVFSGSVVLFFVRDAGLVVFLNLGRRRARADAAALVYLVLLYALIPAILDGAFDLDSAGLLHPAWQPDLLSGLGPVALQGVVMWALVLQRWKRHWSG